MKPTGTHAKMNFKYLTEDILKGFDNYKYNAIDTSPVSKYITHPFWNWFVQFYPTWVAPNSLTLAGFLLLIVQYFFMCYYDFDFYASDKLHPASPPVPNWVWLVCANCMFWAHTLDGTDGKQARRTNSSGPLGELFDHGLDSWATLFMPIGAYSVFGRGDHGAGSVAVYWVLISVMFTFALSHWEKYNTGVLFLPWGYDVSQLGLTVFYVAAFLGGYEWWKFSIPLIGLTSGEFFVIVMHLSMWGCSMPMSVWNVYLSYRDGTGKNLSLYESLRPLFSTAFTLAMFSLWSQYSSYDILRRHPRLFYTVMGTVFSNCTCRLIVSGMSQTRAGVFNWLLVPLAFITVGVLYLDLGIIELYLLYAYTIFATAAHIHYGICVVNQFAEHLNIYVFSVEKPQKKE